MEKKIKKIVLYKERDYNGVLGEVQIWEESDENLSTSISTGNGWDFNESTQGIHLGQIVFDKKNVSPKMAKKIVKLLKDALKEEPNEKAGETFIPN